LGQAKRQRNPASGDGLPLLDQSHGAKDDLRADMFETSWRSRIIVREDRDPFLKENSPRVDLLVQEEVVTPVSVSPS